MVTLKNAKLIKETEKAIQIEFWKKLFWIPKSLSKVNDDSIEIIDWFYKKEIDWKITAKYMASVLGFNKIDSDAEGLPTQMQAFFNN